MPHFSACAKKRDTLGKMDWPGVNAQDDNKSQRIRRTRDVSNIAHSSAGATDLMASV
jgi:hypothetical protein